MEPSSADLRYFLEVVREGNMSKAAYKIGISQPSLSLAMQRIERCLGESILLRDKNGAKPTPAGQILLKKTQSLLAAWDEVRDVLKTQHSGSRGSISIGCHPEVAMDSLPLFMPQLLKQHPELELQLKHGLSRAITEDVINGKLDVGLVVNPRPFPDLIIKTLSYDTVGLWVAKDVTEKSLNTLVCQPELAQSQKIIRQASKEGFVFKRTVLSTDIQVICSLVASGCGVGILPSEVALRNSAHNLVPVSGSPLIKDKVAMIYRRENRAASIIKLVTSEILAGHEKKYGKV